ncbi:hypothetical protein MVEN_00280400 [Mycena venus]|uniref:Uncharacterized protein n=1 Tax=Mycena venus TaxID=2733690 RepID=A0A8H7DFG5_9AGAR|nr:hypothetical protein MVEN_00280400 [Mycena venus]
MYFTRSLWHIALVFSAVRSALTNYTLDDTSPSIIYTLKPFLWCAPDTCAANVTVLLSNGTATLTGDAIVVPFTVYVHAAVLGTCIFAVDGVEVAEIISPENSDNTTIFIAYQNLSMSDTPHILSILPANGDYVILDSVVYTCVLELCAISDHETYKHLSHNTHKSHRAAMIGGIVGGIVAAGILWVGVLFLRRWSNNRRRSMRGIILGDDERWPAKRSIRMVGMADQ